MKRFFFSFVFALTLVFSVNGQYKQSVNADLGSFYFGANLQYERFLYSENKHNISAKGTFGYSLEWSNLQLGAEVVYGFGNRNRVEAGLGVGQHLSRILIDPVTDLHANLALFTFSLGYAYHAKNNPMIYRVGLAPTIINYYGDFNNSSYEMSIYISVGYRF